MPAITAVFRQVDFGDTGISFAYPSSTMAKTWTVGEVTTGWTSYYGRGGPNWEFWGELGLPFHDTDPEDCGATTANRDTFCGGINPANWSVFWNWGNAFAGRDDFPYFKVREDWASPTWIAFPAAHKSLPFGTICKVTRMQCTSRAGQRCINPKPVDSVFVRINDDGPNVPNRILDLSFYPAWLIGIATWTGWDDLGVAFVRLEVVELPDGKQTMRGRG